MRRVRSSPTLPLISGEVRRAQYPSKRPPLPTRDMADSSGPTHFRATVESALQAYEERTGTTLDQDSLTMNYDLDAMLQSQATASAEFRGSDGVLKSMKNIISILSRVFACESLGNAISLVRQNALATHSIAFTLFYSQSHL